MRNEPGRCSVGEYLAQRLEQAGVRHYFTVPWDFNLVLLDQLLKDPRLQLIGCCNELNAGYAAEGYARSNGIGALRGHIQRRRAQRPQRRGLRVR